MWRLVDAARPMNLTRFGSMGGEGGWKKTLMRISLPCLQRNVTIIKKNKGFKTTGAAQKSFNYRREKIWLSASGKMFPGGDDG